jgi:hypothetical protein
MTSGRPRCVEREVKPTTDHSTDRLRQVAAARIQYVGCAQVARHRQARGSDIDGDDRATAGNCCRHDRAQPHGADAEYGNAAARAGMQRVQYGAGACLDTAPERRKQFQGLVRSYLYRVPFVSNGMRGEGRLAKETAVRAGVAETQCGRAIRASPTEVQAHIVVAIRW